MKKQGVLILLIFVLSIMFISISGVIAADNDDNTETGVDKAISCLKEKIEDKDDCEDLTTEQQAFSLLALASESSIKSDCKSELLDNQDDDECWPDGSCKLKETALAILALDNIGTNTNDEEEWLSTQNKTTDDLTWYLEIDSSEVTTCKISYDSKDYTIKIAANKKINKGAGSCLSLAYGNYWLRISDSCLNKEFTVSCNKDFITTLLYQKKNSNIWYLSSDTESASSGGDTEHEVNSLCFKQGNKCNYEGSLWAAYALDQTGNDIDAFLPYLIALAPDNENHFSYAFLYLLTQGSDHLANILELQKTDGYWDLTAQGKYYDTATSLLALQDDSTGNAKDWLLDNQDNNGCWNNNIRDTAFIIWAGWYKAPVGNGDGAIEDCEDYGYYCVRSNTVCIQGDGEVFSNFDCTPSHWVCCNQSVEETCSEMNGEKCSSDEICDGGSFVSSSDSSRCCVGGTCEEKPAESECEEKGYECKSSCDTDEVKTTLYDCDGDDVCCKSAPTPEPTPIRWWVWVLAGLIILVILGLIFRKRIRLWLFKRKGKVKGAGVTPTHPPFFPPAAGARRMPARRPPGRPPGRAAGRAAGRRLAARPRTAASRIDKELEDTLKKLKEMSK